MIKICISVCLCLIFGNIINAQKKSCDCEFIQNISGYEIEKNGKLKKDFNQIIRGFTKTFEYGSPNSHVAFVEAKILKDSIKVKMVSDNDEWNYNVYFEKAYTKLLNEKGIEKVPKIRTYVFPVLVSAMHKADALGVAKEDCKYYEKKLRRYFKKKRYYVYDPLCIIWMGILLD